MRRNTGDEMVTKPTADMPRSQLPASESNRLSGIRFFCEPGVVLGEGSSVGGVHALCREPNPKVLLLCVVPRGVRAIAPRGRNAAPHRERASMHPPEEGHGLARHEVGLLGEKRMTGRRNHQQSDPVWVLPV